MRLKSKKAKKLISKTPNPYATVRTEEKVEVKNFSLRNKNKIPQIFFTK